VSDKLPDQEWGTFKVIQRGIEVAGGSGPYEAIKSEAAHYAAMYAQDGAVTVRVRKATRRRPSP
jgi:hypothetical protein